MNKLNYFFYNTLDASLWYEVPSISFKKSKYIDLIEKSILVIELWELSSSYIKKIVEKLKEVELDYYNFWFETTAIWCYKKGKSF